MRAPERDPAFLRIAAIASTGGIVAIACSIGIPLYAHATGRPYMPIFSLFAAWGIAALGGAYGCVRTYLLSNDVPPPHPPRGLPVEPPPAELDRAA